jgi:hypothetical protein
MNPSGQRQITGGSDMLIDCDSCAARDIHCGDCVVAVLLGPGQGSVELDSAEQQALDAFASGGLLPPLRLVPAISAASAGSPPTENPPAPTGPPPANQPDKHPKPARRDAIA